MSSFSASPGCSTKKRHQREPSQRAQCHRPVLQTHGVGHERRRRKRCWCGVTVARVFTYSIFFWIYFTHPPKIHSFLWCACVQQGVSWTLSCQRSTPPLCWSWEPTAATPRWGSLGCCLPTPSSSLLNSTPTLPPSLARSSPGLEWKIRFGSKQSCVSEWAEVVRMTWGFGEGGHSECLDRWWDKMIKMIGWSLIW